MITTLAEGFLLGLATGTTCLATCGPVYAPYLMQYDRTLAKSLLVILELSAGRFFSYIVVGASAGLLGRQIHFEGKGLITAAGYFLFSVFLLATAFRTYRRDQNCSMGRWAGIIDRPLVLGILTGINICPPFLLALTKAFGGSGPAAGATLFAAFFTGTSLFLLPIAAFGLLGERRIFRSIARWGAVAVSAWFLILAGLLAYDYFR
ncbi:MAG TPA: sulfite exporter TauE/SafE family protein [Chitinivibrionales bacterium]|nr:sulfite exporter TauE/SafE family protein [Chitinivibrionales bacterium]